MPMMPDPSVAAGQRRCRPSTQAGGRAV